MARVVVFDFDGVLVPSNRLKRDAFLTLFPPAGQAVVRALLAQAPEMSRSQVVGAVLRALGEEPEPARVAELADRYDRLVQTGIAELGVAPSVRALLGTLRNTAVLYANSGTPEPSVRATVDRLGLASFFAGVFGGPATKESNLARIVAAERVAPRDVVVVGDGESDRRAAAALGCRFVGLATDGNAWENAPGFIVLHDLAGLPPLLEEWRE